MAPPQDKAGRGAGAAKKKTAFVVLTALVLLILLELFLRMSVKPSEISYGKLFGTELPPFKIAPVPEKPAEKPAEKPPVKQNEPPVSGDDLYGYFVPDPLIGYRYPESYSSAHRWWRTNNVGARADRETARQREQGKKRVIIFGDSFTNCSQVPQEATWPLIMEKRDPSLEVLNFGVDGYGMGQSLLRYSQIKEKINYDAVLMVHVSSCDLLRDINTYRKLIGWGGWQIMPRYVIENNGLKLIKSPFASTDEFYSENEGKLSRRTVEHLRKYDALYIPTKYESPPLLGDLILVKLLLGFYNYVREDSVRLGVFKGNSEALRITKLIFKEMEKECRQGGRLFLVIVLPRQDEIIQYRDKPVFKRKWDGIISSLEKDHIPFVDLMPDMVDIPENRFDKSYDGEHNGPEANRIIADLLLKALIEKGITRDL
ncbi:MAG: hypothetical protein RDV48_28135 [Candidatus Eremiobacteraeota bacterium]|nr:hypothetical protein [Candidatus Eremiobacteraeota bacterium]